MALTTAQEQARAIVLQWQSEGYPILPSLPNGQTNHGEHLQLVAEALQGTDLARPSGSGGWEINRSHPHGDRLYVYLFETQWGENLRALFQNAGVTGPGWKDWSGGGKRRLWWQNRHERAAAAIVGAARMEPWQQASIEAVPGLSSVWPLDTDVPTESEWLADCRDVVLHAEQYAALRVSLGLPVDPVEPQPEPEPEPQPDPSPTVLRLQGGRFEVTVRYRVLTEEGETIQEGYGQAVSLVPVVGNDGGGLFWFFSADNPELLVKALDWRGVNGHWGVSYASTSDAEFFLDVLDAVTDQSVQYHNPQGRFASVQDMAAFPEVGP